MKLYLCFFFDSKKFESHTSSPGVDREITHGEFEVLVESCIKKFRDWPVAVREKEDIIFNSSLFTIESVFHDFDDDCIQVNIPVDLNEALGAFDAYKTDPSGWELNGLRSGGLQTLEDIYQRRQKKN